MAEPRDDGATAEREERIGLHNLRPAPGSRRPRKRVGRGEGSGTGKTSGRGQKGWGSRSGAKRRARFEGGQNPIHMRMRKLRGPHMKKSMPFEPFRTHTQPVNLRRPRGALRVRRRGHAGGAARQGPGDAQGRPGEGAGQGRAHKAADRSRARVQRAPRASGSRPPAAPASSSRKRRRRPPSDLARSSARSGSADIRKKILFTAAILGAVPARDATSRRRASTQQRGQADPEELRRQQHPRAAEPVLGRRPRAGSRSSRSGSCPTSRRRSSCSCCRWWSPRSRSSRRRARSGRRGSPSTRAT